MMGPLKWILLLLVIGSWIWESEAQVNGQTCHDFHRCENCMAPWPDLKDFEDKAKAAERAKTLNKNCKSNKCIVATDPSALGNLVCEPAPHVNLDGSENDRVPMGLKDLATEEPRSADGSVFVTENPESKAGTLTYSVVTVVTGSLWTLHQLNL